MPIHFCEFDNKILCGDRVISYFLLRGFVLSHSVIDGQMKYVIICLSIECYILWNVLMSLLTCSTITHSSLESVEFVHLCDGAR